MTEEEAKTKWCPYGADVQQSVALDGYGNPVTGYVKHSTARCIGPQCMAWRWVEKMEPIVTTYGYCGLAGKP
jgi:hypothetical protein